MSNIELIPIANQKPVTSLKFFGNLLFAGIGNCVRVYLWRKNKQIDECQVFEINRVHGIEIISDTRVIAWGGTSYGFLDIVDLDGTNFKLRCEQEHHFTDWIVSMKFWGHTIYLLSAHNEVCELDEDLEILKYHHCDEKSILYSGKLYITDDVRLAAAGTVLNGIVVWNLDTEQVIGVFKSHKGVIFDVSWSSNGKKIVSCSDDRSICVVDVASNQIDAIGWGHTSRVWRAQFLGDDSKTIISTGEDCTARVWELSPNERVLACRRTLNAHQGRNVWSLSINAEEHVAATGGGDGKVMLWDFDTDLKNLVFDMSLFDSRVRSCSVNAKGECMVSTVEGKLHIYYPEDSSNTFSGKWIECKKSLNRMPLTKCFRNRFFAISSVGDGVIYSDGILISEITVPKGVVDFHVICNDMIVVCGQDYNAIYDCTNSTLKYLDPEYTGITAACLYDGYLILGTKRGDLYLTNDSSSSSNIRAFDSKSNVITSITPIGQVIVATSQSGEHGVFAIPSLRRLCKDKSRRKGTIDGTNMEGNSIISSSTNVYERGNNLLFYGFQNESLVLWHSKYNYELESIECGGSHRSYDVCFNDRKMFFFYVRSPKLVLSSVSVFSPKFCSSMLSSGTHGREIRCLEVSPINPEIIALGSEDTTITIGKIVDGYVAAECVLKNGHISAVQCLHWTADGRFLLTGGGKGELIAWEVTTIDNRVYANLMGSTPIALDRDIFELRVMAFSIFMDLVVVAYSDSSFRIWSMDIDLESNSTNINWKLLCKQKYMECCLLNIDFVQAWGRLWLLISSTDGHLVIYRIKKRGESKINALMELRFKIHKSGIRDAKYIFNVTDNEVWYYTSGDDNALFATKLWFNEETKHIIPETVFKDENAHTSSLTSLTIDTSHNWLITAGSDQKVRFWDMYTGSLLGSFITDVCDTGAITKVANKLVIAGVGLAIYEIKSDDSVQKSSN